MVFPWVQFLGKKKKLSDIEYLAIKEFDGKLVENEAAVSAGGGPTDGATLTANSGKDMYLASASVTVENGTAGTTAQTFKAELHVNGVIHETLQIIVGDAGFGNAGPLGAHLKFQTKGVKVAATQIIKIRIVVNPDITVESSVICWEEDTGASPAV